MSPSFEWGVHLLRPVSEAQALSLAQSGVGRVTVPLPWRWHELTRGARDLASIDHFLAPLRAARLPLQGSLGPAMPHALPDHAQADASDFVQRFSAACAALAAAVPDITVFRVEDALNAAPLERLWTRRRRGGVWARPEFADELLQATFDAVRAARPDAELRVTLHGGLPGWKRRLRRWLALGLRPDRLGLTLQPCFFLPDPELGARCGEAIVEAQGELARGGHPASVEVSRVAYPTRGPRFTPRRQREFLLAAARSVQQVGGAGLHWWALRDQAHDDPILRYWSPPQERHYGLLHYDGVGKPAYDALRVLATGDRFGERSSA